MANICARELCWGRGDQAEALYSSGVCSRVDTILMSDVLYDSNWYAPLVTTLEAIHKCNKAAAGDAEGIRMLMSYRYRDPNVIAFWKLIFERFHVFDVTDGFVQKFEVPSAEDMIQPRSKAIETESIQNAMRAAGKERQVKSVGAQAGRAVVADQSTGLNVRFHAGYNKECADIWVLILQYKLA